MKRRVPASLASAASQISETLGAERMADIVRRSPTLVYKWTDPDLAYFPNLQQALELDHAFVSGGHGAPPFLSAYATLLKQRTAEKAGEPRGDALGTAAQIISLACEILSEVTSQVQMAVAPELVRTHYRCNICEHLRRLGEVQAQLSWTMEHNSSETACPLHRKGAANVECSIGKTVE